MLTQMLHLLLTLTILASPHTNAVWNQLRQRYLGLKTLSGDFEETLRPGFDTVSQTFKGSFSARLPGSYRIEVRHPERQIIVGNDNTLWFYFPAEKRALRQMSSGSIPLLAFLGPLLDSSTTARAEKDATGRLRLTVNETDPEMEFSNFTFTLDQYGKSITQFSFSDAWGNAYEFRLLRQQWNPRIPARTFQFTPPRGTQVDSFDP